MKTTLIKIVKLLKYCQTINEGPKIDKNIETLYRILTLFDEINQNIKGNCKSSDLVIMKSTTYS